MLYIYTSNKLEYLSGLFSRVTNTPLSNPFSKEIVVVQNAGMGRWLSIQQADFTGISANIDILFPAEFMWKLLRIVSSDVSEQSQCTPETLQYHLMQELSSNYNDYPELHHYIKKNISNISDNKGMELDEISIWSLSVELSQIFDQYLFFRSDWIDEWESDSLSNSTLLESDWQARLWVRCVKDKQLVHWLHLQKQFKESISSINKADLPERITFFSMPALSPGYLDLLSELSKKTDVYLYMINPCKDIYWGDILSEKTQSKLLPEEQQYVDVGNPLLASMGKQGRDFIHQLIELGEYKDISNTDSESQDALQNNILNVLQQDIYNLNLPQALSNYNPQDDNSIRFNACHTAMREVEVLYDQILDALDSDSSLTPADIVVMHPDVENYAPYIDAIFSNSDVQSDKTYLPFSIADRNPLYALQLIEVLLQTLKLVDTRFDVESVFEILDFEDVYNNFDLEEKQIKKCRQLAQASNIRWGISDKYRAKQKLPKTQEHTWKYALDSLLLGYALGENLSENPLYDSDKVLPLFAYNEIEGNEALILANFKRFTDTVFKIDQWSNTSKTVDYWLDEIKELITALFIESSDRRMILTSINNIKQTCDLTEFTKEIPFSIFYKILEANLSAISGSENFLGHGITFCSMVPMRSIPFKLVVLMGMNDGEFPRQNKRHSFDRLAEAPRRGDRSKRDEDRYLFLESILAARKRLIISYIGQNIKDNSELPPSVLVSELLDTLEVYSQIPNNKWITKHPLQAFSPRYFDGSSHRLYSYSKEYIEIDKHIEPPSLKFIEDDLLEKAELSENSITKNSNKDKELSLSDLIHFYQSPARSFLKHRFGIQTFEEEVTLAIREPFSLESFKDRDIRHLISEFKGNDLQQNLARAKGLLPYGEIGEGVFNKQKEIVDIFEETLPEISYLDNQPFSLKISNFSVFGEINHLTEIGRCIKSLTQAYFTDFIDIWFNHLILNEIQSKNNAESEFSMHTLFYSPEASFSLSPVKKPRQQLETLIDYYELGQNYPLNFFPKSAKALYERSPENLKYAATIWNGNSLVQGERDKFENWLLHRTLELNESEAPEEFLKLSELIFGEIYSHFEEI